MRLIGISMTSEHCHALQAGVEQSRTWRCKLASLARGSNTEHLEMMRLANSLQILFLFQILGSFCSLGWKNLWSFWLRNRQFTGENGHFFLLEKKMYLLDTDTIFTLFPGTGEPGGLPSMWLHRIGHDWRDLAAAAYWGKFSRPVLLKLEWANE